MRKIRYSTMLIICLLLWTSIAVDASSKITIDLNKSKEGIVRVSYAGISKKTKVMVEKGSIKYYYDLKTEEDFFPLQLGNGSYKVAVLENTAGTKYKTLEEKTFKVDILEENSVYLLSTQPVLWNEEMDAVKLAKSITRGKKGSEKVVQVLHDYIVRNIAYDREKVDKLSWDYMPDIDTVLREGKGICYDYSALFGAMLRSSGVPAKLVKGYREGLEGYHAWNEVYLDGSWKIIDTTYDAGIFKDGTSCQMFQDASKYNKLKEY